MIFYLRGHRRENAVSQLLICLYPDEDHHEGEDCDRPEGEYVISSLERRGGALWVSAEGYWGDRTELECPEDMAEDDHDVSEWLRRALYLLIVKRLDEAPQWGSLTGVKPAKLVLNMLDAGLSAEECDARLKEDFFVSDRRRRLALEAALISKNVRDKRGSKDIELYIGIPFCPAKCSYCSFVSNDVRSRGHLVEPYLDTLLYELKALGDVLSSHDRRIKSVYIGGGTPSILSEPQLERLLLAAEAGLDLSHVEEYTLEAGRPETITRDKLIIAKGHGVRRISINPQTTNDEILRAVGRLHTARDIFDCYDMARNIGGFEINMDLIAGLPGDDDKSLRKSVSDVVEAGPDNVTLHSMARKRGAPLRFGKTGELPHELMDECHDMISAAGYSPYYLYRQKYSAGGLENVGFAREGRICRYNVIMMEESGDVAALGSGGVTKLVYPDGSITRITNAKYPIDYVAGYDRINANMNKLAKALERY